MLTLGQAMRARRERLGRSLKQVADEVGCARSYLSTIENDRRDRPPSETLLRRLERSLGFEEGALLALCWWQRTPPLVRQEVREMQRRSDLAIRLAALLSREGVDAAHRSGELQELVEQLAPAPDVEPAALPVRIPIINKVAAGYPREFTDLGYPAQVADEYVSAPEVADPDAFAARVVGDSMAPQYCEGDIVVFSPEAPTPSGSDCFVRLARDDETTFKRVYFERDDAGGERIRLQPLNSAFPPRVEGREDVAGLYAAVYVIRPVRAQNAPERPPPATDPLPRS